jgi:Recombinase
MVKRALRLTAIESLRNAAKEHANLLAPTIKDLQASGCESLRSIAEGLNEKGISTAHGGEWTAVQVSRVLSRISE